MFSTFRFARRLSAAFFVIPSLVVSCAAFADQPEPSNPLDEIVVTAMALRESGFRFLLILVCLGTLTLSFRLALWLGFAAALAW